MCDQNIAVSIRNLNQMSSIIPNRMEKLKIASLSAGMVAGFTTDCLYSKDISLSKGYNDTVKHRVDKLAITLRDHIVLNTTWYDVGAITISNFRNIFTVGRKHPTFTLSNILTLINNVESDYPAASAAIILDKYSIPYDILFHRLIDMVYDEGLSATLLSYKQDIVKKAMRIRANGERLDIFDESQISIVISTLAGILLGYTEQLPSTIVDFNNYYAQVAYPSALTYINQLVEKLHIDTTLVFSIFRDTLETRYELAYEPVAVTKGVIELIINNASLPEDMVNVINQTSYVELTDYIVKMVKEVYVARQDEIARSVLHELDYLPIVINPIVDMVNRPESMEEVEQRIVEQTDSTESLIPRIKI